MTPNTPPTTTVILHGGNTKLVTPQNDEFFSLFTSLADKPVVNIAMVYWARNRDTWKEIVDRDKPRVESQSKKMIHFTIPETPAELLQKMKIIDVVYVAGGDASNIEPLYGQLGELKTALRGKIYLGSSMGAFMASQNYVLSSDESDGNTVHQGLGLLPINSLCHWNVEPDQEHKLQLLREFSDLEIACLNESEFIQYTV